MNRRQFLAATGLTASTIAWGAPLAPAYQPADRFVLSNAGSGRATAYSETNKVVTVNGKTHASWLDVTAEGFRVRIRTLDHGTGTWSDTYTIGEGQDNHGGPSLTVDSKDYLHVAYYAHNGPMRYRRSLRPNDASEWTRYLEVGETLSYPTLVCRADDTLLLTGRSYHKTEPWTCTLFTKGKSGTWDSGRALLQAKEPGYAQFMDAMAWSPNHQTLHMSFWFYGGDPGIGKTIGYLQSPDGGTTWTRRDGTPVSLPANEDTVDLVHRMAPDATAGLRGSRLAVSPDGIPHVLWSDYAPRPQAAWLSHPAPDGTWTAVQLNTFLPAAFQDWGLLTPGGVTFNDQGECFVVLTLIKPKEATDRATATRPAQDIALFHSQDGTAQFRCEILPFNESTQNRWLPNLEVQTGFNTVAEGPGLIYTEGERGDGLDDVLNNKVHWLRM